MILQLEKVERESEQWKKESIKWSVEDFRLLQIDGWEITKDQAQAALEQMIYKHDAEYGIGWETLRIYITDLGYGRKVKEGKEYWRKQLNKLQT